MTAQGVGARPVDLARVLDGQHALLEAPAGELFDRLAAEVCGLVPAESAVVLTVEQAGLLVRAVGGSHCAVDRVGDRRDLSGTLSAMALATGRGQLTSDRALDDRLPAGTCDDHANASIISAPLLDGAQVVGVVTAYHRTPGVFDPEHVALLELFGRLAGTRLAQVLADADRERLRRDLTRRDAWFEVASRIPGLGWWEHDLVTDTPTWSEELFDLLGVERGAAASSAGFMALLHPDDLEALPRHADGSLAFEPGTHQNFRVRDRRGGWRTLQAWTNVEHDDRGLPVRAVGVTLDVTDQEESRRALEASEQLFRVAFDNAPTGMLLLSSRTDRLGEVLLANDVICELLGLEREHVVGTQVGTLLRPEERRAGVLDGPDATAERYLPEGTLRRRVARADGAVRELELTTVTYDDGSADAPYGLTHVVDVTDSKAQQRELERLALTDVLTGLHNRAVVEQRVHAALGRLASRGGRGEDGVALLLLDLDRFKLVNDTLGHSAGDALLVEVAARLRSVVRESAVVGRLGGDEFVVLLERVPDRQVAASIAGRLLDSLRAAVPLPSGRQVVCTGSVGVSLALAADRTAEDMLREADLALYRAKDEGRDRYAVFDEDLRAVAVVRMDTENRLRRALQGDDLRMHLQPVVDLADGRNTVVGYEALLRVHDGDGGTLLPLAFVAVAEETGLIVDVDTWVLRQAVRTLAEDRAGVGTGPWIAVNVSGRTLVQPDFPEILEGALAVHGVPPSRLAVEITERILIEAGPAVQQTVRDLRSLGVRVGLDDFGTGYSALSHLQRFDLDFIKVDRSFVRDLDQGPRSVAMVRAVVDLAHALGLDVVAEGVETLEQAAMLRDMGCDRGQGWLFGRPGLAVPELGL